MLDAGGVPRLIGIRLGTVATADGLTLEADGSMENSPAVLFDALVLLDGKKAVVALLGDGHTLEYVKDQYRHCKTILALGASRAILERCGISVALPSGDADPGLILVGLREPGAAAKAFVAAVGKHRHVERDRDPPLI